MRYATSSLMDRPHLDKIGVIIPTFNAGRDWHLLRQCLDRQGLQPEQILIIDSSSSDDTAALAESAGFSLVRIAQREFSHGGTRQLALQHFDWADHLIYLTQDALPLDESAFRTLCGAFTDPTVGAAWGRQLPRAQAGAIEQHARLFNYPEISSVRTYASRQQLGIKAAFLSNSFAAYRRTALHQVGGFPTDVIMAEDSVVAARLLLGGWKVAYVAEATVVHSHALGFREEFCRYFDTGVHHAREAWLTEAFGKPGGEGRRFLLSEFSYLLATDASLIPQSIIRTLSKFAAYNLGLREKHLATSLKKQLSLQPAFWDRLPSFEKSESKMTSQDWSSIP